MSNYNRPRFSTIEDNDTLTFKTGDVVYLKSGGPGMTVETVTGNVIIECTWFSHADDRYKTHPFKPELLSVR
jgi:uncharacterized protein YodC (DUF2158 family)